VAGAIHLAEEGIDAPKALLRPLGIEWMVVTLRALRPQAEKQTSRARSQWHKVKMPIGPNVVRRHRCPQIGQDVVHRSVIVVLSRCRDQIIDDLVVLAVLLGELLFEPYLHLL